ncbi:hypothetical protein B1R32_11657 [Abditibacterium utsteinense]|uniref:Alpha-2-macroglobulin n=1 Tax=Abditibacterium utsteinense TaxID=1960156 RepID=A0A2S8SQL3_9BACT|nr:MG2 domain-containing protein [Abditibacterium utsteinense]PQV63080.1 hypothetical protein B1R32_11657 [Abditibacterium utsteinense]
MKNIKMWLVGVALLISSLPVGAQNSAKAKLQPPTINVGVGRDVAPGSRVQLTINTRNLPGVQVSAWRLSSFSWLLNRERDSRPRPDAPGPAAVTFGVDVRAKNEKKNPYQIDSYRSRQINLPLTRPGVYLVEARKGEVSDWGVVNVTNLAVVTKRSPQRLLAWVTNFRSGQTVSGAQVNLWNRSGQVVAGAAGKTAKDGTTIFPIAGGRDQVLVVTRGDDAAGVTVSNPEPDGKIKMHFQTDRPVYRPGHTVFWKAILRATKGRGWEPLANQPCKVEVRDSKDIVFQQETLSTNARGTLSGQVEILQEGALGQYTVTVARGAETQYGSFTVAAYRKPEYQVALQPLQKRYLAGEVVKFHLGATYFFGAPVPKATVHYTVRRVGLPLSFNDDGASYWYGGDGNLYDSDSYGQNEVIADSSADLDETGQLDIAIPTDKEGGDATYSIEATVTDASRRQVSATSSAPVYRASKRIGVSGEVSYVPVGYLMPLRIRVVDLDGKAAGGTVKLELQRAVWNPKERRTRYENITTTSVLVPANGLAKATLPAQTEGNLRVRATLPDGTGRTALATWDFWVAGPNTQWQRDDSPKLTLKPDKRFYVPGETMKILVATNTANHPVLATIEGLDIWNYAVIPAGLKSFIWKVPARVEESPNAFAAATQWTKNGLISDNAILPLPDPSRRLQVDLKSDKVIYRPGETAHYTLSTRDEKGRPIAAEVAVAMIDAAIYSVRPDNTPDLYAMFWANRENFVSTASSAPEEVSGGAFQRVGKTASVRQQFLDTAFWNAKIETGAQGTATFAVKVPGNLTTWRTTARAITSDTRVGMTTQEVLATRPVTLRLATPRQLVQGDAIDLIASVNNRTSQDGKFETSISAPGLTIEGAKTKTIVVKAKGEGKTTFPLSASSLPESGEVTIKGRTLSDAATKENAEDLSDALESRVPVLPNGIVQRLVQGGTLESQKMIRVTLPANRIEPATTAKLTISRGIGDVVQSAAQELLRNNRDSAPSAAARLLAATLLKPEGWRDEARENIALLSRYQTGQGGWNWWEDQRPDARVTAQVLSVLSRAQSQGLSVPPQLLERGVAGAKALYNQNQLWEERALLASALVLTDAAEGKARLEEVQRRAEDLSPFARLTLAEALIATDQNSAATKIIREVLKDANIGTDETSVPVGIRDGWQATTTDATSAALSLLVQLNIERERQTELARWLANPAHASYLSLETQGHRVRALWKYNQAHPGASEIGNISVSVNGQPIKVPAAVSYRPLEIPLPRSLWQSGESEIRLSRSGSGELFWNLEAQVSVPTEQESGTGVRVFRRYEVQNAALTWQELDGPLTVGKALRCIVVVWPDDRADALKVVEPIPAGFEYVDSDGDYGQSGQTEVRDGAVVHYLHGHGLPVTFRYYLRSETTGHVTALPALAEVLQRPETRGNSTSEHFDVRGENK